VTVGEAARAEVTVSLPWISLYTLSEMKDISSIDKMKGKEKG